MRPERQDVKAVLHCNNIKISPEGNTKSQIVVPADSEFGKLLRYLIKKEYADV